MSSLSSEILSKILSVPAVMLAFTIQGYAKALVADRLGDKTPRFQGRLTMNPIAHIDPIGFIMILILGFGWTKPVNTNPSAYKRGYKDSIKVSIAPVLGTLTVGFLGIIFYYIYLKFMYIMLPSNLAYIFSGMIYNIGIISVYLTVFTLLPLPGLPGFDIFRDLSPKNFYKFADKIYQYQFLILILVIYVGRVPLSIISGYIIKFYSIIASLVVGLF
jgi:Zn-dependent protease